MLLQIGSYIARHGMLPAGARVIAAVSGGADSVGLLHILRELVPQQLVGVAHFNHGLRGAESDGDERFVAELAAGFGLTFFRASAEVGVGNLEQNARRARLDFFKGLPAERIALGHTLDDQAETVLFRLLRGSGLSGLAGILPVTAEGLVRPLLGVRRDEVRAYLTERGITWREDSSNASDKFARNRIRHGLLPELARDWNPQIAGALAHLADVAYEEEVWWAGEMAKLGIPDVGPAGFLELPVALVNDLPRAFRRRVIRHLIHKVKGNLRGIDYSHVEAVAVMVETAGSARVTLPGLTVVRSFDWLLLRTRARMTPDPIAVQRTGRYVWPSLNPLIQLEIELEQQAPQACDTLDLELRGWRAGDEYWPLGHQHTVKLKDLFQKARVPSWRRASWPIITGKGKILWAKEFGPSSEDSGVSIQEIPI